MFIDEIYYLILLLISPLFFGKYLKIPKKALNVLKDIYEGIFLGVVSLFIYWNSSYHISNVGLWKYYGGEGRLTDFPDFKESFRLEWPRIYLGDTIYGYVMGCYFDKMWVYSLSDNNLCKRGLAEYIEK